MTSVTDGRLTGIRNHVSHVPQRGVRVLER